MSLAKGVGTVKHLNWRWPDISGSVTPLKSTEYARRTERESYKTTGKTPGPGPLALGLGPNLRAVVETIVLISSPDEILIDTFAANPTPHSISLSLSVSAMENGVESRDRGNKAHCPGVSKQNECSECQ